MIATLIYAVSIATLAAAAPATLVTGNAAFNLNGTDWTPDIILRAGEVILYGGGRSKYRTCLYTRVILTFVFTHQWKWCRSTSTTTFSRTKA